MAAAPLRERRWAQLMVALYRSGRQGEALRTYQDARRHLADELGIEPGPELRRLEAAVLAQDDDPRAAASSPNGSTLSRPARRRPGPATAVGAPSGRAPCADRSRRCIGRDDERAASRGAASGRLPPRDPRRAPAGRARRGSRPRWRWPSAELRRRRVVGGAGARSAPAPWRPVWPGRSASASGAAVPGRDADEVGDRRARSALQRRRTALVLDNCEHVVDEVAVLVEQVLEPGARRPGRRHEPGGPRHPGRGALPRAAAAARRRRRAVRRAGARRPGSSCGPTSWPPAVRSRRSAGASTASRSPWSWRPPGRATSVCDRTARPASTSASTCSRPGPARRRPASARCGHGRLELRAARRHRAARVRAARCLRRRGHVAAARAVCAGDGVDVGTVEPALARLVDKSLVVVERGGPPAASVCCRRRDARGGAGRPG